MFSRILPPKPQDDSSDSTDEKPFTVEMRRADRHANGAFRPSASLRLNASFRTSGLLAALPPEDLKTLLLMLTFLSDNGDCLPAVVELAEAMQVSAGKAASRLERLAAFRWRGGAIATEIRRESGLHAYAPTPVILVAEAVEEAVEPHAGGEPLVAGSREAVIAHSRATYGRPRKEVERTIAQLNGWPDPDEEPVKSKEPEAEQEPDDPATMEVRRRLTGLGVGRETIDSLLEQYGTERVLRQLKWLPYRHAKSPARYLLAAVEDDYDEPLALRFAKGPKEGSGDGKAA